MILLFSPILTRLGYGLKWYDAVVMIWGGLRGAIGLALALQVALHQPEVGNKVSYISPELKKISPKNAKIFPC